MELGTWEEGLAATWLLSLVKTRLAFCSSLAGSVIGLSAWKETPEASASCFAGTHCKSSFNAKPWHRGDLSDVELTRCTTLCLWARHCSAKSTTTSCLSPFLCFSFYGERKWCLLFQWVVSRGVVQGLLPSVYTTFASLLVPKPLRRFFPTAGYGSF